MKTVENKIQADAERARQMIDTVYRDPDSEEAIGDAITDLMHLLDSVLQDDPEWPDPRMGVLAVVETAVAHWLTESHLGRTGPGESADGLGGYTNPATVSIEVSSMGPGR